MFVVTLWQKDDGPDVDRMAPELCEHVALNLDVLDELSVGGYLHRWDGAGQIQAHVVTSSGIEVHALHFAVEIPRGAIKVLPFPLVHVRPNRVAVRAVKLGVNIDQRLHVVVARGDFAQAAQRIAKRSPVNYGGAARCESFYVGAEYGRGVSPTTGLQTRLGSFAL